MTAFPWASKICSIHHPRIQGGGKYETQSIAHLQLLKASPPTLWFAHTSTLSLPSGPLRPYIDFKPLHLRVSNERYC